MLRESNRITAEPRFAHRSGSRNGGGRQRRSDSGSPARCAIEVIRKRWTGDAVLFPRHRQESGCGRREAAAAKGEVRNVRAGETEGRNESRATGGIAP